MKKIFITIIAVCLTLIQADRATAQATVAMDFNRADCNGIMRHLFTNDLDSGNVVILEFFMGSSCPPCIYAGQALETMKAGLSVRYPGKIRSYVTGHLDAMDCTEVQSWCSANGITATPIDSGAAQLAHYGGFGMPTLVMLAGSSHKVIFTKFGFWASDTADMKDSIKKFFDPASVAVNTEVKAIRNVSVTPSPAQHLATLNLSVGAAETVDVAIIDVAGRVVSAYSGKAEAGGHFSIDINTAILPAGLYTARISAAGSNIAQRFSVAH